MQKQYGSPKAYERKLHRVMQRLGVESYSFDWGRAEAWVQFTYRGQLYRFEHGVKKARDRGIKIAYGSDAFAQLVLALEDLARIVERGIYDLQLWVEGMKYLPPAPELPECFRVLGFDRVPERAEEVTARFRELAKRLHPDAGGSAQAFQALMQARDEALAWFGRGGDSR